MAEKKAWAMFRDCKGGSDEFSRVEVEVTRNWLSLARSTMRNCVESSSHAKNTRKRGLREASGRMEWNGIATWNSSCGWREKVQAEVDSDVDKDGARITACATDRTQKKTNHQATSITSVQSFAIRNSKGRLESRSRSRSRRGRTETNVN